jgi:hypothetical protein
MPTGWMIDCLVSNCPPSVLSGPSTTKGGIGSGPEWLPMIVNILSYIADHTSSNTPSPVDFYQIDSNTPLFPNHEIFDDYDAYRFSTALLQHIKALA